MHFQWIPSHVNIYGNELADMLVKERLGHLVPSNSEFPYLALFTRQKARNKEKICFINDIKEKYQGFFISPLWQTVLICLRAIKKSHFSLEAIFPICPKFQLEQASQQHILNCPGLDWEDVHDCPLLLVSDFIKVNVFNDLVRPDKMLVTCYGDQFNCCQVIYSQFGLAIHQNDHQARRRFVEWAQNEIAVVPDFHKRILFSDEAHFWLNGYVNKQNCRIWSEANPQVYVETPLHSEKLTVWCTLWAGGIIGPYFFKNDEGHNITVNGDRYRAIITNFFIPELNNHHVQELWFQQDGATCHSACDTIHLLKDTFGDRLISRFGTCELASKIS
ncbi:uncharacterized protein TNCV_2793211 [Trichonephila clavipes]|nr:uncharacterized protein TNCV_2793211 [Trichonephila clavipes]